MPSQAWITSRISATYSATPDAYSDCLFSPKQKNHLFAVASQLTRRILRDYARTHRDKKRGGDCVTLVLHEAVSKQREVDLVALDDALAAVDDTSLLLQIGESSAIKTVVEGDDKYVKEQPTVTDKPT